MKIHSLLVFLNIMLFVGLTVKISKFAILQFTKQRDQTVLTPTSCFTVDVHVIVKYIMQKGEDCWLRMEGVTMA